MTDQMTEWTQIAPQVWQARYQPLDVSIVAIRGDDGVLVADTRCNPREGAEMLADLARLGIGPVRWVVNTHAHYDHTFGNQVFTEIGAVIHGHAGIAAHFEQFEGPRLSAWMKDPEAQPQYDWRDVGLTPPSVLVDGVTQLDLGGRCVHLIALEPGHTDTDLVIQVPDAGVWVAGDVVEESGPPMYGSGSFPFGWPGVLADLAERIAPDDVVVPGHGRPVDRRFVADQGQVLAQVADRIRSGFDRGQPEPASAAEAAAASGWPLEIVESAVRRGYAQLAHPRADLEQS